MLLGSARARAVLASRRRALARAAAAMFNCCLTPEADGESAARVEAIAALDALGAGDPVEVQEAPPEKAEVVGARARAGGGAQLWAIR